MTTEQLQMAVLGATLIAMAWVNWTHLLIPDILTLPAAFVGLVLNHINYPDHVAAVYVGVLLGAFLPWVVDRSFGPENRVLGAGIMKGGAMLGAFLGWQGVLVTYSACAVVHVGIAVVAWRLRQGRQPPPPFTLKLSMPWGVFMAIGATIAAVVGARPR